MARSFMYLIYESMGYFSLYGRHSPGTFPMVKKMSSDHFDKSITAFLGWSPFPWNKTFPIFECWHMCKIFMAVPKWFLIVYGFKKVFFVMNSGNAGSHSTKYTSVQSKAWSTKNQVWSTLYNEYFVILPLKSKQVKSWLMPYSMWCPRLGRIGNPGDSDEIHFSTHRDSKMTVLMLQDSQI